MYVIEFEFETEEHFKSFKEEIIEDLKEQNDNSLTIIEEPKLIRVSVSKEYDLK